MEVVSTRRALLIAAAASPLSAWATAAASPPPVRLTTRPARVFKIADLPRENTEGWFLHVIAETNAEIKLTPERVALSYLCKGIETARSELWGEALRGVTLTGLPPVSGTHRPFGLRLISRQPSAAAIDTMRVLVSFADAAPAVLDVAIGVYKQVTDLIFPFRGNGIVTQAGAANGGHRNGSGQFAIDAMGLDQAYAVQTSSAIARNTDLAGWGRELIAPGAGVVVVARGDRPDQPVPGESNPDFHVPELRGAGDPGNHIVIDHGGGEFSLVAHMMAGSLAVRESERLKRGQRIGLLGNSGDSFAPHVHHQLQSDPAWQTASGLPHQYGNVAVERLDRGTFFTAS